MQSPKKIILLLIGILLIFVGFAHAFVYRYNGPANGPDEAYAITCGSDNNLYIAGKSWADSSGDDFLVISLTNYGSQRWLYSYNGPNRGSDEARSIVYGTDGNVYAVGKSSAIDSSDIVAIGLTTTGMERWVYRYNGPGDGIDEAYSIIYGDNGNLYIAGKSFGIGTGYDFTIICIDPKFGIQKWVYRYNGPANNSDVALSIVYGSDGNLYAVGYSAASIDSMTYFTVLSLTNTGNLRWVYRYNEITGATTGHDVAYSLVYGSDGNIYVAGKTWDIESGDDFTVISLNSSGNERWIYKYKGFKNCSDGATSIIYGSDGKLYAAGWSNGFGLSGEFKDFTVTSLTLAGSQRWVYTYDGPGKGTDIANGIVYTRINTICAAGLSWGSGTYSDIIVIHMYTNGFVYRIDRYNGPANGWDCANSIVNNVSPAVCVAGKSQGIGTDDDLTVVDYAVVDIEENNVISKNTHVHIPSIFKDQIKINFAQRSNKSTRIAIYDLSGKMVFQESYPVVSRSITIKDKRICMLANGVYCCRITTAEGSVTQKIIKLH